MMFVSSPWWAVVWLMFCSTIVIRRIQKIQETDPTVGLVYLYCSYKDQHLLAESFVQTLLHQLVGQSEHVAPEILAFHNKHMASSPALVPHFTDFEQALRHEIRRFAKVYVVVDALDECQDDDNDDWRPGTRKQLLETLGSLEKTVHLLFTSRDKHPPASMERFTMSISSLRIWTNSEDIRAYIDGRLKNAPKLQQLMTPDLIVELKDTIVEKAQGMYVCVFRPKMKYHTCKYSSIELQVSPS